MKVYPSVLATQIPSAKKESLSVQIRVVLIESAQLFTALLVFLGIDALLAWIWPNQKTHHRFLDFVVLAGWLAMMMTLGIFRKSSNWLQEGCLGNQVFSYACLLDDLDDPY